MSAFELETPSLDSYTNLSQAIADAPKGENVNPITHMMMAKRTEDTRDVAILLSSLGFRKVAPLMAGNHAVVVDTCNDQILRITDEQYAEPRAKTIEQLQAIQTYEVDGLVIEVLAKGVPSSEKSPEAYNELKAHLEARNYPILHLSEGDAVYLIDKQSGEKVALGSDCDVLKHTHSFAFDPELDAKWVTKKRADEQESIFPQLQGTGYTSMQERICPAITDHRVRGVLTDGDKETLLQPGGLAELIELKPECFKGLDETHLPEFIKHVFDEGLYPQQALEVMGLQPPTPKQKDAPPEFTLSPGTVEIFGKGVLCHPLPDLKSFSRN